MFAVWRKKVFIGVILAVLAAGFAATFFYGVKAASLRAKEATIVIDAGHGGRDGGVSGIATGVKESDLNLKYAFLLKEALEKQGFRIIMTRSTEDGLYDTAFGSEETRKSRDMLKRKEIILEAKPVCVISLHMNFFQQRSVRGAQVFYDGANQTSKALAVAVQNKLNKLNTAHAKRNVTQLPGDYYIVKSTVYPTCIIECGFLSSEEDEKLLINPDYQRDFIYEVVSGVLTFLGTRE